MAFHLNKYFIIPLLLLVLLLLSSPKVIQGLQLPKQQKPKFALVTGGAGRTGTIITSLLLDQGFDLRLLVRNVERAQNNLKDILHKKQQAVVEFVECELGDATSIRHAFATNDNKNVLTHVVYCAGGDDTDYNAVSFRGVAECAKQAVKTGTVEHFVFISTSWSTRPYSIASLLFNTIYDTIPMACHYMGEEEIRKAAAASADEKKFNYVILRPGSVKMDHQYDPKAATMGLTYQQGDEFQFLRIAGRPGMSRTQLANAVVAAVNVEGRFTVEITGSGTVDWDDSSIYDPSSAVGSLYQDEPYDSGDAESANYNGAMEVHAQAVEELKRTAVAASVGAIVLITFLGWTNGLLSVVAFNTCIIFLWRRLYADTQI